MSPEAARWPEGSAEDLLAPEDIAAIQARRRHVAEDPATQRYIAWLEQGMRDGIVPTRTP